MCVVVNILQLFEKPFVNLCQRFNPVYRESFFKSIGNGKDAQIRRIGQCFFHVIECKVAVAYKAVHTLPDHAQPFLDDLFKRLPDRHDFTH